jgi:hypothetical protein
VVGQRAYIATGFIPNALKLRPRFAEIYPEHYYLGVTFRS